MLIIVKSLQKKSAIILLLSQSHDVFPCSGHSMALFKLNVTSLTVVLSAVTSSLCNPSLYLDLVTNPIRDKPITHACPSVNGRCYILAQRGLKTNSFEIRTRLI